MNDVPKVCLLISLAGGEVVGRTKLQKLACLLQLAGMPLGIHFNYHIYGPYSDYLMRLTESAVALDKIRERREVAAWGGEYFVYSCNTNVDAEFRPFEALARLAADSDNVELELAVTAGFLASKGVDNVWGEVLSRKKVKSSAGRLENARVLYQRLRVLSNSLPAIAS